MDRQMDAYMLEKKEKRNKGRKNGKIWKYRNKGGREVEEHHPLSLSLSCDSHGRMDG